MTARDKLLPLESVRGIAALFVVVHHLNVIGIFTSSSIVSNAYVMVDFFFVLSGFVIALNYFDRIGSFQDVRNFMVKRFWRLYPLHLVMMFAAIGTESVKWGFEKLKPGVSVESTAFATVDWYAVINNLLLTHALGTMNYVAFNYPSWSISTEFWTYVIFAVFILSLGTSRNRNVMIILSLLLIAACLMFMWPLAIARGNVGMTNQGGFLRCVAGFFSGVIAFRIYRGLLDSTFSRIADKVAWVCIAACFFLLAFYEKIQMTQYLLLLLMSSVLVLSLAMAKSDAILTRVLSLSGLVYLGTLSYSIYMTHAFVEFFIVNITRYGLHFPVSPGDKGKLFLDFSGRPVLEVAFILLVFSCVLVMSHFTYYHIEDRYRRGFRATTKKPILQGDERVAPNPVS